MSGGSAISPESLGAVLDKFPRFVSSYKELSAKVWDFSRGKGRKSGNTIEYEESHFIKRKREYRQDIHA